MKKQSNIVAIVIGGAVVVAAGFYFITRARKRTTQEVEDKSGGGEKSTTETSTSTDVKTQTGGIKPITTVPAGLNPNHSFTFPIKYGDGMRIGDKAKQENVKQLQYLIIQYDNRLLLPFNADGKFGSVTESAVKKIIGKSSIDSQSDIDSIKQKTVAKAKGLIQNLGMQTLFGVATR